MMRQTRHYFRFQKQCCMCNVHPDAHEEAREDGGAPGAGVMDTGEMPGGVVLWKKSTTSNLSVISLAPLAIFSC